MLEAICCWWGFAVAIPECNRDGSVTTDAYPQRADALPWSSLPLPPPRTHTAMQVVSSLGSFRTLRTRQEEDARPMLPFLGLYLTDLTMLDQGDPPCGSEGTIKRG